MDVEIIRRVNVPGLIGQPGPNVKPAFFKVRNLLKTEGTVQVQTGNIIANHAPFSLLTITGKPAALRSVTAPRAFPGYVVLSCGEGNIVINFQHTGWVGRCRGRDNLGEAFITVNITNAMVNKKLKKAVIIIAIYNAWNPLMS
jgi:hypothetical protein